jgi:hypothetical protein
MKLASSRRQRSVTQDDSVTDDDTIGGGTRK